MRVNPEVSLALLAEILREGLSKRLQGNEIGQITIVSHGKVYGIITPRGADSDLVQFAEMRHATK